MLLARHRALAASIRPIRITTCPRLSATAPVARQGVIMKITAIVKGDPATKTLGDCPFCHRVLLTLEAKAVPYDLDYIDFDHKPEWLLEKAAGKVPVIKEGEEYTADSDAIVARLDDLYPDPSLKSDVPAEIGSKLFPAFREYLMSSPEEAAAKQEALTAQLRIVDDYLVGKGPLFGGDKLNATDAAFAPKLHHAVVALGHFKGWKLSDDLPNVQRYYTAVTALPEWKAVQYSDSTVISGWARHGAK